MPRVDDLPVPGVPVDGHPRPSWMAPHGRLVIALERLPQSAYVWDDVDPAVVWDAASIPGPILEHGYINGTASVTTPDAPELRVTGNVRFTARLRDTSIEAATSRMVAHKGLSNASSLSWRFGQTYTSQFYVQGYPSGTASPQIAASNRTRALLGLTPPGTDRYVGVNMTGVDPGSSAAGLRGQWLESADGVSWAPVGAPTAAVRADAMSFDDAGPLIMGLAWQGRIYWVQAETLDAAGNPTGVVWRFDADDYPGTGTSYVDPRGRTWTLSAPGAITAAVREPVDELVWDAPFVGEGYTDAWCDMTALEVVHGEPDNDENYRTGYCRIDLRDPGDGRYRSRTPDGRLVYFAAGRRVCVYWLDADDVGWWLFRGTVATWRDGLDGNVVVEAYTCTGDLARALGREWTAGTPGQLPRPRLEAILAETAHLDVTLRADLGDAALAVPAAANVLPLDALRLAARSDGGIIYADADDTLVYRDRRWRDGRTDQTARPLLTSNVCDAGVGAVVLWEPVAADIDLRLAASVSLSNIAGLTATAPGSPDLDPALVFMHPEPDLWQDQQAGDLLAAHLGAVRSDARMALGNAAVYLHDARFDYWRQITDLRLGDLARFQHTDTFTDPPRAELYDVDLVITTLRHRVTADTWVAELATSPAVDYTAVELWDWTLLTWDDPNPLAVWR